MSELKCYSKVLEKNDYNLFDEHVHISNIMSALDNHGLGTGSDAPRYRLDHTHRRWEYGLIINAMQNKGVKNVLDIGGGGSLFAPSVAWLDIDVTQIDAGDVKKITEWQEKVINKKIDFLNIDFYKYKPKEKFDAVVACSVIEHVDEDIDFWEKMLSLVNKKGIVALTTDFHESGKAIVDGHLRTYNEDKMKELISYAKKKGFDIYKGTYDYSSKERNVYEYNFCSLIMEKK